MEEKIITTKTGIVKGKKEGGYFCFKGVPYAWSERFKAPQEYSWEGVLDCSKYGPKAMQVIPPECVEIDFEKESQSEDCQNLNIYIPGDAKEIDNLPVLLEIHGGAYQNGSNRDGKPESFIRDERFIYVNINYRLGVLGFLYLGDLLGEEYQTSGNNGLLDQLAAIKWVHDNIASFGGNPDNITVMGASAGGKSIGSLMMLPEFDGCVSKVIISSGAVQSIRSVETSIKTTNRFMELLKNELGLDSKSLLSMSSDDIIKVQKKFCDNPGNTCMFGPVADGVIINESWGLESALATKFNGNCLIGSSRNEMDIIKVFDKNFLNNAPTIADYLFGVNGPIAKTQFEVWLSEHEDATSEEQEAMWAKILTDYMYRLHSHRLATRLANKGCKVWEYSVELYPAYHCADQNLAFNPPESAFTPKKLYDVAVEVGDKIRKSFISFISCGNPSVEGWDEFDSSNPKVMFWDEESSVRSLTDEYVLSDFPDDVYKL